MVSDMNFPYFSRCLGFFLFFFQEFGCGPGGCHPFIFECMMPLRRKGNEGKGVGDLPPPITSKAPRLALNSPVSFARRTLRAAPSSNIWHIISTIGWLQALQNMHTVVYWGYWVGCVTGGCPLWQVGSLRCFSFWWLVSWRCWRWVLPSAVSSCDSDGKTPVFDAEVPSSMQLWCRTNRETYWTYCEMGRKTLSILSILCCPYVLFLSQWPQLMCQDSPVRGLWLCTVWASAASVDPAVTAMEGVPTIHVPCR